MKSDYDATKLLQKSAQQEMLKKRLTGFQNGRPKQDPLFYKHQLQETLSKKRLSSLQSLNRTHHGSGEDTIQSSPGRQSQLTVKEARTELQRIEDSKLEGLNRAQPAASEAVEPIGKLPGIFATGNNE